MGDLNGKGEPNEKPVHKVNIKSFLMGKYVVTFNEYDVYVKASGVNSPDDEGWGRGNRPVINVSWSDAKNYIRWLNKKTGKRYRLPSESEWEYAARAGTTSLYHWGNIIGNRRANCNGCATSWGGTRTAPVGLFDANAFSLFDIHGNVWEWVQDAWHSSYKGAPIDGSAWLSGSEINRRVLRGGAWLYLPSSARSAVRYWFNPINRYNFAGFRLAQDR